jgi:uncharacterized protein Yka (UPF0111/DUF47 family)
MLETLFQDERKFYERFSGLARGVTAAAVVLKDAFDSPEGRTGWSMDIGRLQREANEAAHAIDLDVDRMFVAPMDRGDIRQLSFRLRRVMDIVGATAIMAVSLRAIERREPAVALARCLVTAVSEVELAIGHIRNGDEVLAHCREIMGD